MSGPGRAIRLRFVTTSRARRAGGTLAALTVVLTVAVLLPLVALGSRPEGGGGGDVAGISAGTARLVLDVVTYLFIVFVLLTLLVIVWALWPQPDQQLPQLPPRRRRLISTLLTGLIAVGLALWLRSGGHLGQPPTMLFGGAGVGGGPRVPGQSVRAGAVAGFDWLAAGVVVALLAAVAVLLWWRLRPPRRTGRPPVADLRAVLDEAIDDLPGEADPRRAVIAAWVRLERVLARHGLPRRASEAPFEFAARAGAELDSGRAWLEQLAGLFEWARFSTHDVTPGMREEALRGLLAVREGLSGAG